MAVKVSQATIDKIKAMGMTKALKGAANASPEMREGLKRMYGAKRVANAIPSKPTTKSADQARGAMKPTSKPVAKSADAARAAATKTSNSAKAPVKKVSTTSNPFTAAHNKFSPYGNKDQKYVSGFKPGATRKSVPGKPSIGEQISAVLSGKGVGNRQTESSVAAINAKRMGISVAEYNKRAAALAAKKKNK